MASNMLLIIVALAVAVWSIGLAAACVNMEASARANALRRLAASLAVLLAGDGKRTPHNGLAASELDLTS